MRMCGGGFGYWNNPVEALTRRFFLPVFALGESGPRGHLAERW